MSKSSSAPASNPTAQAVPIYRVADLIWCQEARNNKLWWPAMVTYDPHIGIFYRVTKSKSIQFHVQYFGISAIRGWVGVKSCVPFRNLDEKSFVRKGLSKKAKAEYEVAIQEVSEAASLDYKQRKLKFIFSFSPSRGKERKPKVLPESALSSVKIEKQEENVEEEAKEVKTASSSSRRRSTKTNVEGQSSGGGNTDSQGSGGENTGGQSSGGKSIEGQSSGGKGHDSAGENAEAVVVKTRPSRSKDKVQGEASLAQADQSSTDQPVCLHSQHCNKPLTRRRQSESTSMDCDKCIEYIVNSDGVELTCNSKPEVIGGPDMDVCYKPILMYVQKEYEDGKAIEGSKMAASPTLNRNPLTKGLPTKNIPTNHLSSHPKRPSFLATKGKTSEKDDKSGSGPIPLSPTNTTTTKSSASANGNLSSESGYETGKNTTPSSLLAHKKKKRRATGSTSSVLAPSPLVQVQSSNTNNDNTDLSTTRKRKRIKSTSNLPDTSQMEAEDENNQTPPASEEGLLPIKRMRKANSRYSLQSLEGTARRNLAIKGGSILDSADAVSTTSTATNNDSCSDISSTSVASPVLTPPTSSSEESPSMDLEFDAPVTEEMVTSDSKIQGPFSNLGGSSKKVRHDSSKMDSKLSICCICDCEDTGLLACTGQCMNLFHLDCLGLVEEPKFKFVCDECLVSSGNCFVCGNNQGEVKKCSRPRCDKLYHLNCIKGNKLFQFGKSPSSFTCPLHVCAKCTSIGISTINNSGLLQCVKCPIAFHKPDCLVAGCEVINQTHMLCYQHVKITKSVKLYSHVNLNTCLECGSLGSLYCCDVCSAAYHLECLDEDSRPANDSSHWKCPSCAVHDLPTYGSLVIVKFGVWRWWPSEIVLPEDIPDNILPKKPGECMFVVRFCGSRDFCWTYHGRVLPFLGGAEMEGFMSSRKGRTPESYQRACEEAKEIYKTRRVALEAKEAARQNSKFYTKIRTNKYLVPRPPLDPESPDFLPCQCTPENPCREDSVCVNRAIHIECNPKSCPVGDLCRNQRMQKCQNAKTETFFTGNRGWGLKAAADLSVGDFVIEYVGEVLDEEMCKERLSKAHAQSDSNFYMLTLDAGLVIDACQKSNQARFINHSCGPNCETQKWRVRGEPRIGIFARQNIPVGTELTFDYHLDSLGNEKKKCHCGSKYCSGFLGLRSSKTAPEDELKVKLKSKKKKKKPRPPKKDQENEPTEDRHDDDCFVCKDGGELLLCDHKSCSKAYHLECLNRKIIPPKSQKWECPWHFCTKCQKTAFAFCSLCPVSYCSKHLKEDELTQMPGSTDYICHSCSSERGEGGRPFQLQPADKPEIKLDEVSSEGDGSEITEGEAAAPANLPSNTQESRKPVVAKKNNNRTTKNGGGGDKATKSRSRRIESSPEPDAARTFRSDIIIQSPGSDKTAKSPSLSSPPNVQLGNTTTSSSAAAAVAVPVEQSVNHKHSESDSNSVRSDLLKSPSTKSFDSRVPSVGAVQQISYEAHASPALRYSSNPIRSPSSNPGVNPELLPAASPSYNNELRGHEAHRSPSAFRTCLNRAPLFQHPQVQSPTIAQNFSVPTSESSHSATAAPVATTTTKVPDNSYMDFGAGFARAPGAAGFQQSQQLPASNNLINPVWFMPRNGLMNGLDPGAAGSFSYPSYPLINHGAAALGFPYPGYFSEPMSNFESFNFGMPQLPPLPTSSSSSSASSAPTATSFPAVFPPTHPPQNGFLAWKYC